MVDLPHTPLEAIQLIIKEYPQVGPKQLAYMVKELDRGESVSLSMITDTTIKLYLIQLLTLLKCSAVPEPGGTKGFTKGENSPKNLKKMFASVLPFDNESSSEDAISSSSTSGGSSVASSKHSEKKKKKDKKSKSKGKKSKHKKNKKKHKSKDSKKDKKKPKGKDKKEKKDKKDKKEKSGKKEKKEKKEKAEKKEKQSKKAKSSDSSSSSSSSAPREGTTKKSTSTTITTTTVSPTVEAKPQPMGVDESGTPDGNNKQEGEGINNNPYSDSFVGPKFSRSQLPDTYQSDSDDELPEWARSKNPKKSKNSDDDEGEPKKLVREEWMKMPPKSMGEEGANNPLRMLDMKTRKFKTDVRDTQGKKGKDHGGWTKDPLKKRKREEDGEVVVDSDSEEENMSSKKRAEAEEKRLREQLRIALLRKQDDEKQKQVEEYNKEKRPQALQIVHDKKRLNETKGRIQRGEGKSAKDWDWDRDWRSHGLVDSKKIDATIKDAGGQLSSKFAPSSTDSRFL